MDLQRQLLDDLLGKTRNLTKDEVPQASIKFYDSQVCKHFLCGFCPHELFVNTKSSLGTCGKLHDPALQTEYKNSRDKGSYGYEHDFTRFLERLIYDLDKRIEQGRDRVETDPTADKAAITEKVDNLTERIVVLVKQMEELAEKGMITESQQLMADVDKLKADKERIIKNEPAPTEKRMQICETCGAFLVVGDSEKRIQSHLEGRQHQGYLRIRNTLESIKKGNGSSNGSAPSSSRHTPLPPVEFVPSSSSADKSRSRSRDRDRSSRSSSSSASRRDRSRSRSRERRHRRSSGGSGSGRYRDDEKYSSKSSSSRRHRSRSPHREM